MRKLSLIKALTVHCHVTACNVDTVKILNPEDKNSRENVNLTISPLLLNLTDANFVFNDVQHTNLC